MTYWYVAVCDKHKEYCDIFVKNPTNTKLHLSGHDKHIEEWLSKHYNCELRFIFRDDQMDYLSDNNYKYYKQI